MIAVTGLAGYALAADKTLATAPLTCYVIGSALTTVPASFLMNAIGRRGGFQVGTTIGILGAGVCSLAMYFASFWLLCAGMMVMGMYTAFGKYYRFAAADAADPSFKAKAISLPLAGGIGGGTGAGVCGAGRAGRSSFRFAAHAYLGASLSLGCVCLIATLLLMFLDIPKLSAHERKDSGRRVGEIMSQPVFIVAALASALSY